MFQVEWTPNAVAQLKQLHDAADHEQRLEIRGAAHQQRIGERG